MTLKTRLTALLFAYVCAVSRVQAQPAEWWLRTPADQVMAATKDLEQFPPEIAQYIRYLDLANIPLEDRVEKYLALSGHLQGLSTRTSIVKPLGVHGTGTSLLRINILDYGSSFVSAWENLKDFDPYYHQHFKAVQTVVTKQSYYWPGGKGDDGQDYPAGTYYRDKIIKKNTITNLPAPWLSPTTAHKAALAKLYALSKSEIPIVHGDWFLWQTAIQAERGNAGYYDFIGVKNQKDFEDLIGFDQKVHDKKGYVELRAAVGKSGVTRQPRAIARFGALDSPFWKTFDFELATLNNNPLEVLGKDIEKDFTATEQFGVLNNGWWCTGLFDKNGVRQDSAPDKVAGNRFARTNDTRIHVNLSCLECHSNAGLHDFTDWIKHSITPPPGVSLKGLDYEDLILKRDQYLRDLKPFLEKDRLTFTTAVKTATGLTPGKFSKLYADAFWGYEEANVNLQWISRDLGIPVKELKAALLAAGENKIPGQIGGSITLTPILKGIGEQLPVPLRQYHETIPRIMEAALTSGYYAGK